MSDANPQGIFTQEDVDTLREMIDTDDNPETAPLEYNAFITSLADRIEAILRATPAGVSSEAPETA
jgi:hypothetical protein